MNCVPTSCVCVCSNWSKRLGVPVGVQKQESGAILYIRGVVGATRKCSWSIQAGSVDTGDSVAPTASALIALNAELVNLYPAEASSTCSVGALSATRLGLPRPLRAGCVASSCCPVPPGSSCCRLPRPCPRLNVCAGRSDSLGCRAARRRTSTADLIRQSRHVGDVAAGRWRREREARRRWEVWLRATVASGSALRRMRPSRRGRCSSAHKA